MGRVRVRGASDAPARIGVGLLIAALVISGLGPPILLLFALLDVLGVTWTGLTMRAETAVAT